MEIPQVSGTAADRFYSSISSLILSKHIAIEVMRHDVVPKNLVPVDAINAYVPYFPEALLKVESFRSRLSNQRNVRALTCSLRNPSFYQPRAGTL